MFQKIKKELLNLLFPPACICCKKHLKKQKEYLICPPCLKNIKIKNKPLCFNCRNKKSSLRNCHPETRKLFSPTSYDNKKLEKIIKSLKYKKMLSALKPIKLILEKYFQKINIEPFKNSTLIPIPLHPHKKRKRGFNQSLLISRKVKEVIKNKKISIRIKKKLKKKKRTKSQTNLNYKERSKNIKDCFQVKKGVKIKRRKKLILVDDVCTTGSTLKESAQTLKKQGFAGVDFMTFSQRNTNP
ncbi:MAG: ComF family protein [Candidatus Magasanikbacteria bacterium]